VKLKNTFFKKFDAVEKDLSDKTATDSLLSISIRTLETKIDVTLKKERDDLITEKADLNNQIKNAEETNKNIDKQLKEVEDYEPQDDHLMFQGLLTKAETEDKQRIELEAQLTQLVRSKFTLTEVEEAIRTLETEINSEEDSINDFDNLLYQNISNDPEIIRKAYSLLNSKVAKLDKSKIKKEITTADFPFAFFDGRIDASEIEIQKLPTIKELQDDVNTKKKELGEKKVLLDAIKKQHTLQRSIDALKESITSTNILIEKVRNKPLLVQSKTDNETLINVTLNDSAN
jgi:hypothetical protein